MDEEIDVELRELPRQHIGFGSVEIKIAFKVATQLEDNFVSYYRTEIVEAGESIVVILQRVNETLDFTWRWRSVSNDLYQCQLVQN
jgi:hypothetical protein